MSKETIKCTDDNIKQVVEEQVELLGNEADLNHLDVNGVTNMKYVFSRSEFNGDISKWNVSDVTLMESMFYKSTFNNDISRWDVSSVSDMSDMFSVSKFSSDISKWDVSKVTDADNMFWRCSIIEENMPGLDW